jgi:hypothetical protein
MFHHFSSSSSILVTAAALVHVRRTVAVRAHAVRRHVDHKSRWKAEIPSTAISLCKLSHILSILFLRFDGTSVVRFKHFFKCNHYDVLFWSALFNHVLLGINKWEN